MMKLLSALAVAAFVVVAVPSVRAAPASAMLAVKTTNSVVEPVYLRRHWHAYRYWHRRVYWGHRHYYRHAVYSAPPPLLWPPGLLAASPLLSVLGPRSSALRLVMVNLSVNCFAPEHERAPARSFCRITSSRTPSLCRPTS